MTDKILSLRPDRATLFRHLEMYIRRAEEADKCVGLIVVNLKGAVQINSALGYKAGDLLLELFADRLQNICREQDRIVRTADYEFTMILPSIRNEGHTILAANKLLRTLEEPFSIEDRTLHVGATMGIAVYPLDASHPETLLQRAELALSDAEETESPYVLYSAREPSSEHAWSMESALDAALETSELELFYQPKINLRGGLLVGAEALMRWNSPTLGPVPPSIFIPLAAQTGQIRAVTRSALNMALQQSTDWPTRFGPLTVAVNISPTVLEDVDLVDRVRDAMGLWGTKPNRLTLEITETAVMKHPETSFATIRQLKGEGVAVSIDDFGTGYSSLANFKNIPASELKIDNSFVTNMELNETDAHLVHTIIELAHGFDLAVVAEGVHDRTLLEELTRLKCDYAQGYYIGKPMSNVDFIELVKNYSPLDIQV